MGRWRSQCSAVSGFVKCLSFVVQGCVVGRGLSAMTLIWAQIDVAGPFQQGGSLGWPGSTEEEWGTSVAVVL